MALRDRRLFSAFCSYHSVGLSSGRPSRWCNTDWLVLVMFIVERTEQVFLKDSQDMDVQKKSGEIPVVAFA